MSRNKKNSHGFTTGRTPVDPDARWRIFKRDGYACVNCGETLDLHIDHAVPCYLGGSNDEFNLQTLCRGCNLSKKTRILNFRFAALCKTEPALLALERECESFIFKGTPEEIERQARRTFYGSPILFEAGPEPIRRRLQKLVGHGRPYPEMEAHRAQYPHEVRGDLVFLNMEGASSLPPLPNEFIFTSEAWDIAYYHLSEVMGVRS